MVTDLMNSTHADSLTFTSSGSIMMRPRFKHIDLTDQLHGLINTGVSGPYMIAKGAGVRRMWEVQPTEHETMPRGIDA